MEGGVREGGRCDTASVLTWLQSFSEVSQKAVLNSVDLIVCIGGDGTLLYTSTLFPVRKMVEGGCKEGGREEGRKEEGEEMEGG